MDADVRKAILAAAVDVIGASGLADVSMREVARRAGVSHQLPYHYFTDREGILAAIALQGFAMLDVVLAELLDGPGTGAEKLEAAGRAYVDFACAHPAHFRVMFRCDFVAIDKHPAAEACANSCFGKIQVLLGQVVEEGLDDSVGTHESLVLLGWSIAHGLATLILDGPLSMKLPDAASQREATIAAVMRSVRVLLELGTRKKRKK